MAINICKSFFSIAAFFFLALSSLPAQNDEKTGGMPQGVLSSGRTGSSGAIWLTQGNPGPYTLTELSDWSRYENGKYIGHVYREIRASILPQEAEAGSFLEYRGNFFVLEETLRDMRQSARGLDAVIPVNFRVSRSGSLTVIDDKGFPSLRGFPSYPAEPVRPGAKWTSEGSRAVDPLNQGRPVIVPLIAEYEYRGTELYRDIPVHRIHAQYASRYQAGSARSSRLGAQNGQKPAGDDFQSLQGAHTVDILLRVSDGLPLLIRDNLDETFTWPGGGTLRFRGFTLTFGQGIVPLDRKASIIALADTLHIKVPEEEKVPEDRGRSGAVKPSSSLPIQGEDPSLDITPVPEGIRLTLRDLRFAPDSADLLPGEKARLDAMAQALQGFPDRTFLVEGHTASVGRPQSEMQLSVERAQSIVTELVTRGIPADRFIYKGSGGTKPVGDNSGEEGRRLNRRVEITILE
ncbi:MAG: OmpA family protein [Treponema sp.]|jgi:outer membrane protein OmpA-like peptidoglycan-associated protein|nr:OmpA family protein [Treponema sp.]